jgi:signal transduction histidine kinase
MNTIDPLEDRLQRIFRTLNRPWKVGLFSPVIGVPLTWAITYLTGVPIEWQIGASIIAFIGSFTSSYLVGIVAVAYQKVVERKNSELEAQRDQLLKTNEALQMSNADLEAFARTVAHDLKNPLSGLIGYSAFLLEELDTADRESMRQILIKIESSGRKMSTIIDEILLLSQMRLGDVQVAPLNTAEIVSQAIGRLSHHVEEYQAEIRLPAAWPPAVGYAPWVEQIWVNYLSNGLKYGGKPPHLELGATLQGQMVQFWVRDNGPGLTEEAQQKLFTEFTRLDPTQAEGHGLGLSIVRRIVEKLGGQVGVTSQIGQGSTFYFTLPHSP